MLSRYKSELITEQSKEKIKAAQKAGFEVAVEIAEAEKLKESRDNSNTNSNNNSDNNNEAQEVTPPRDSSSIKGKNSNGIFNIHMMTEFIRKATKHAPKCCIFINLMRR